MTETITDRSLLEAEYERIVRADIEEFRARSEDWVAGKLTDDQFRAVRLRRGVYTQRQAGVHMIRTKVPGGILTSFQMEQMGRAADEFAGGKGHLTTRQNMQYHFVPLAQVPDLLHLLADARLTTREACYNTVRNVTACPLAGLCRDEVFDVNPYARQTALAFLHKELTDALPRKFKIAFSGCKDDCMVGAIHDVGLRAVVRNVDGEEQRGFRVVIGGGLGPLPCEAHILDEFLPVERLVNRIEAVVRLFNNHGNRQNKNKARLKFVLRERGWDWVKAEIEREYADILENGGIATPEIVPEGFGGFEEGGRKPGTGEQLPPIVGNTVDPEFDHWLETNVQEQKHPGYAVVTARVDQGNLTGDQMRGLARIAREAGEGALRFTIDQNIVLGWIHVSNLKGVYASLRMLGLAGAGASTIEDVVTCPGAYSCNLALTKSMNLGEALSHTVSEFSDARVKRLSIKISGCPNSCGQHWIGDVGFYGNSRKIEGKEVPYYLMLLGGGYDETGIMRFGFAVGSLPARLAPEAVRRVLNHYIENRAEDETFRQYVVRHKIETFKQITGDLAKPSEYTPEIFRDWGDDVAFSLQLGRGECAS